MDKPKRILEDDRPITMLVFPGGDSYWQVGACDITRIVAYAEAGQSGYVPWFAVYAGEAIMQRVNAAHVEDVRYGD